MLLSIALILLVGMCMSWICQKIKLPGLLGMLATGVVLGPYVLNLLDSSILGISSELRKIALIIILTRAGLGLDLSGLKKIGRSAVMMCFVPASHDCILSISTVCCAGQTYCRKQDEQYQDLLSYCTKETKNKGRMKKISFFMRPLRGTCPPSPTSRR